MSPLIEEQIGFLAAGKKDLVKALAMVALVLVEEDMMSNQSLLAEKRVILTASAVC